MKRLLLVACYFPPVGGGGVQRPLKFSKYLPQFGWQPVVLSAHPGDIVFPRDSSLLADIPPQARICRTRLVGLNGWYARFQKCRLSTRPLGLFERLCLLPDKYVGWLPFALPRADKIARKLKPDAVLTTGPPHSAHLIGLFLKRRYGINWITDFRDPWTQNTRFRPASPLHRRMLEALEKHTLNACDAVIANTDRNRKNLVQKFGIDPGRVAVITNGFDPDDFAALQPSQNGRKVFTVRFLGTLYDSYNLHPLFQAVKSLHNQGKPVRIECYGSVPAPKKRVLEAEVSALKLQGHIRFYGYVPHDRSLNLLWNADLLLLMLPERNSRHWIPGKLFEYLAAPAPVLAIVPDPGSAADILRETEAGTPVPNTPERIARTISDYYTRWQKGEPLIVKNPVRIASYDRRNLTRQLADLLDR